ncbi:hypothetical protein BST61_g1119 [Cercospora zeina]
MQHFRFDQPSSYLTPLPLFSDNVLVDTEPARFERVTNTRITTNYKFASTQRRGRFPSISSSTFSSATSSTLPTHNRNLRSTFEPIPRNLRQPRPPFSKALAPVIFEARQHSADTLSRTRSIMQDQLGSSSATMYHQPFPGLLQGFAQTPVIIGTGSALQKLADAQNAGLVIAQPPMAAAVAFQLSLQPFETAGTFPSDGEMNSLFSLPELEQRACGFDQDQDFSMTDHESARNMIAPPLMALRVIECARKYLEIGNRYRHGTRYCFDVLIITVSGGQLFVHDLPPPSNSHSTHSVLMLRHVMPNPHGHVAEIWQASATTQGVPPPRPTPLSFNSTTAPVPSSSRMPQPMPSNAQAGNAGQQNIVQSNGAGSDPLVGVTRHQDVDGNLILRVAMHLTNKEIYEKVTNLGSTASYNSVTKRITNSLKSLAKSQLRPGEAFDGKYKAMREAFNKQRDQSLGRQPAKRAASSVGGGKGKRQKIGSEAFVANDDSDLEEDLDDMDIQDEEVVGTVEDEGNGGGSGYSLRRRTPYTSASAGMEGANAADEDMEDGVDGNQSADESAVSEFDDTEK